MQLYGYDENDLQLEAENRIRNLMWTVSGDYALDTKVESAFYTKSRYVCLYDAAKQGAFARYYDVSMLSMYLIKKAYYGADEQRLVELAQLCVDAASYPLAVKERPGISELRRRACEDLLEYSFEKMSTSLLGRLKIALLRGCLDDNLYCENQFANAMAKIRAL